MTRTNGIRKNRMKDFSITDTATKLLLWRHKMWRHQYFHHLFCCSKVENENSMNMNLFQQNISFLEQKLEKNIKGFDFWRKVWLIGLVSGGSVFFLKTVITRAPFEVTKKGFRCWTPLVKFFQMAHLFAWKKNLDIKDMYDVIICDVITWDFVLVIMSKRLGQQPKHICQVWWRNGQKTQN